MSTRQYIGARYVPKFFDFGGSTEWRSGVAYEALTIVTKSGNSYTSKIPVPSNIGEPENNPEYWAATGLYNEQIESYRQLVEDYAEEVAPLLEEGGITSYNIADNSVGFPKLEETVAEIIFMPVSYYTEELAAGDCTVIRSLKSNKTIMIDSGSGHSYTAIYNELIAHNITHIDYFILTHYHGDHYWNIPSLKRDHFIDDDTIAYIPPYNDPDEDITDNFNQSTLITANNSTVLDVDDIHITFLNCSPSDVAYYNNIGDTDINNHSMCNYVTIGTFTAFFTADISEVGQIHLCESNVINHCNVFKIPHHGTNDNNYNGFFYDCSPDVGIVSSNDYTYQSGKYELSSNAITGTEICGAKIYTTGRGAVVCGVRTNSYSIISNGEEVRSYNGTGLTIWVDNNYTGAKCTGSKEKPFKSIKEAIAFARSCNVAYVSIKPVTTYVTDEEITIRSCATYLELNGISIKNLQITNSTVNLINCNLTSNTGFALNANSNSYVYVSGLTCDGNTKTLGYGGRAILCYNSFLIIENSVISNKSMCVCSYSSSSVTVNNVSGENNNIILISATGTIFTNNLSFPDQRLTSGNLGEESAIFGSFTTPKNLVDKYDGTSLTHTIDLSNVSYARRMFLLCVGGGGMYFITRWGASINIATIHEGSITTTVTSSDFTISVSVSGADSLVCSLIALN